MGRRQPKRHPAQAPASARKNSKTSLKPNQNKSTKNVQVRAKVTKPQVIHKQRKNHTKGSPPKPTTPAIATTAGPPPPSNPISNSLLSLANWTNPNPKHLGPFNDRKRILTIGDGDFSFSLALAVYLGGKNITATCYDSRDEIAAKYSTALSNVESLQTTGVRELYHACHARVLYQIDATHLHKSTALDAPFDSIVFNFPHLGGATDEDIAKNQQLLYTFFKSSRHVVTAPPRGEVLVSLRRTLFYDKWLIDQQAQRAGLELKRKERFDASLYAGYEPQRTHPASLRGEPPTTQGAVTYVFQINNSFQRCDDDTNEQQVKPDQATLSKAKSVKATGPTTKDTSCWFCSICRLQCKDLKKYNAHLNSAKHARKVKAHNKSSVSGKD